ncbi:MAG: amino acid permease [Candidatus Thermoplasmatota archaeon]|nr:amino acid permease [Candidatus Thermoplasmatota archaeon]
MTEKSETKGELSRHLTFKDVFFLSFGGMSPLLSILTYGAFAITLAGFNAPIVMIIGTLLVLINGLVVTQLSKRFATSGGYYSYAFQGLSERLGFDTGWMYIFYSILYGLAYLAGSIFIIDTVFNIPLFYTFLLIMVPSVAFLIIGVKASSRYALYAVILEISLMLAIVAISFFVTKGKAYIPNPLVFHTSGGDFALGILFAMGIPTGYGAIAPLSGEIRNPKRIVGRSVITVILFGGLLASLMIYAFANLVYENHIVIPILDKLPIISMLKNNFGEFGIYLYYAAAIATVNDGILAVLSFGSAASRTIFRMGYDRTFPHVFSFNWKDRPIVATTFIGFVMVALPLFMLKYMDAETMFIFLGTVSALGGLFIHVSSDFSLLHVGIRSGRRFMLRAKAGMINSFRAFKEPLLAAVGAIISTIVLIYSAVSTVTDYTTLFLAWIVIGFVLSEVKSISSKTHYRIDLSDEDRMVVENLVSMKVKDAIDPNLGVVVTMGDTIRSVMDKLRTKNIPKAIVIDHKGVPIGTVDIIDMFLLPKSALENSRISQMPLDKVTTVDSEDDVTDAMRILRGSNIGVLAVIDSLGKCIGTLTERQVLMSIDSAVDNKTAKAAKL